MSRTGHTFKRYMLHTTNIDFISSDTVVPKRRSTYRGGLATIKTDVIPVTALPLSSLESALSLLQETAGWSNVHSTLRFLHYIFIFIPLLHFCLLNWTPYTYHLCPAIVDPTDGFLMFFPLTSESFLLPTKGLSVLAGRPDHRRQVQSIFICKCIMNTVK